MDQPPDILRRNLVALRRRDPELAERIEHEPPAPLHWLQTPGGSLTATIDQDGRAIPIASRYSPEDEARKLVGQIDHGKTATVVLLGVGLGYHVQQVLRDQSGQGLIIAFEPDRGLLRAVLEKIDCTRWLQSPNVILADGEIDQPALLRRIDGRTGVMTQGLQMITHPISRQRSGDALRQFSQIITETLAYCRTNVATALVNSSRTCSNLVNNLTWYAAAATTDDLYNAAKGCPAVCVAAGPSLVKNVDLLRDPQLRSKVVVIAVQTALRLLLERGIKPDFVTALDYSRISSRFYENLPDLPDVTLVAEAKAHPAILDLFPGPIRCVANEFNDKLLGQLARPRIPIRSGATVAHLSFYLAQHLGCDPIIMIGQDLGFSDGLYYCPGTAVHQVWSSELNLFNTVEMMEWTRVLRMRGHLKRATDIHGRPIFTDEQMATYLKQFERDFATAPQQVIDATEGGVAKAHTVRKTLAEALGQHATAPVPKLPVSPREPDPQRLGQLEALLERHVHEIQELRQVTRQTIPILKKMLASQRDAKRMEQLFRRLNRNQSRVGGDLNGAFNIVQQINTVGAFRRSRADRAIGHEALDEYARQARQIQRDMDNLEFLAQACDDALDMFGEARQRAAAAVVRWRSDARSAA